MQDESKHDSEPNDGALNSNLKLKLGNLSNNDMTSDPEVSENEAADVSAVHGPKRSTIWKGYSGGRK